MHLITLALLLLSPAEIAVLQRPVESPYGLMTEREWISAMSHFVFGVDPEQADAIQRQAEEEHRLLLAKKDAKAKPLVLNRQDISAISHFVFGTEPDFTDPDGRSAAALKKYLERERQKDEKTRLAAQRQNEAKAKLRQLIAECDAQLVPEIRAHLPPAEVLRWARWWSTLNEILQEQK